MTFAVLFLSFFRDAKTSAKRIFFILFAGLFFAACSGTVNIPKNQIDTNIDSIDDQTVEVSNTDTTIDLEFSATTLGSGSIIITATSSDTTLLPDPEVIVTDSAAGLYRLLLSPIPNKSGSVEITITLTAGSKTKTRTFTVTFAVPNQAPIVSTLSNQTINEDSNTGTLSFTISDNETLASALSVSAQSDNTTLIPNENLIIGGSGANRTLLATPETHQSGIATITVSVSDGRDATTQTFTITVNSVNDAPTITTIANQTVIRNGNSGALAFTIGDIETAVGSLSVTGSSSNTTLVPLTNVVLAGTGASRTVTVSPASNQTGTTTITLNVNDGTTTTQQTFVVTVLALPSNLSYGQDYFLFSPTMSVTISKSPTVTGTVSSYSISPSFGANGLTFNTTTGEISGKPPGTFSPTIYTITATNAVGSTITQITMESMNAFYVDDSTDEADKTPGDGLCEITSRTQCTLRAATDEAAALAGTQSIIIPAGTSIDLSPGGPINLTGNTNIYGESRTLSIVSAEGANRVFVSSDTSSTFNFVRFQIRNGSRASSYGGCLSWDGNTAVFDEMRIQNCSAQSGGAISIGDNFGALTPNLTITESYFSGNSATANDGGAIEFNGPNLSISDTTFINNSSAQNAGAVRTDGATVTVTRTLFQTNSANYGGGMVVWDGSLNLTNSTFSANTASNQGGAISAVNSATLTLINNTFYQNTGAHGAGALVSFGATYSIKNSLFYQNLGSAGAAQDCLNAGFTSTGNNMTSASYSDSNCGFEIGKDDYQNGDPGISPLADNTGYTLTHAIEGNPPIDSANNTGCPAVDGRNRGRSDGLCDIGAYEAQ
jgi:predicted outer membrane repeat protein